MVEGKVLLEDLDPAFQREYERAAKVMKTFLMTKAMKDDCTAAEVMPGVLLGSIGAAQKPDYLTEVGVTHVLCVGHALPRKVGEEFVFKEIDVYDSPTVRDLVTPIFLAAPQCFLTVFFCCVPGAFRRSS